MDTKDIKDITDKTCVCASLKAKRFMRVLRRPFIKTKLVTWESNLVRPMHPLDSSKKPEASTWSNGLSSIRYRSK